MDSPAIPPLGAVHSLFALQEEEAYTSHVNIYEVRIKTTDNGWLAILKGTTYDGWVVAFVGGRDFHQVLSYLALCLEDHKIVWRTDEYPARYRAAQLGRSS